MIRLLAGDCRDVLPTLPAESVQCVVTDPPYHLTNNTGTRSPYPGQYTPIGSPQEPKGGFMGKQWDGGSVAFQPATWRAVWRVMKPGAHLIAFGGTRTSHRMTCAIEDAGFEIRDTLCWLYGSGFPKSRDVSKAIDRAAGVEREVIGAGNRHNSKRCAVAHGDTERLAGGIPDITAPATFEAAQWQGWGTALKPAFEPIILARKPLKGTVEANVLKHATGAVNIDACRVPIEDDLPNYRTNGSGTVGSGGVYAGGYANIPTVIENVHERSVRHNASGRWPANLCHDGSNEVEAAFAAFGDAPGQQRYVGPEYGDRDSVHCYGDYGPRPPTAPRGDVGSASRFFYCAKADKADRADSRHPTVKPVALLRWLVRLVTPPGGTVLDPFAGSGTTGEAAMCEGFDAILIERDAEHVDDIRHRIDRWSGADAPLFTSFPPAEDPEEMRMVDLFTDMAAD